MPFWERLINMCTIKGCKPNTIAKSIGLSTATATKWKNGSVPNGEALAKIADYLDCSVDYLLGKSDIPSRFYNEAEFSPLDRQLINLLSQLTDEQKQSILRLILSLTGDEK